MTAARRACAALIGAAALAVPAVGAAAAPATTGSGQISVNTGSGWTHDPTTPLFDVSRIAPGWKSSVTLGVRNDSDQAAALSLHATDVIDDENGCNHPESYVDTTCTGDNAGELGKELILSVYADTTGDGTYAVTPTWTGSVVDLEAAAPLAPQLAPGKALNYRVDAELPYSSGNETQTDQVSFDLVVNLDGTAGVQVEGTKISRPSGGALDRLPFTGTPAERLVAAGLSLLLAGVALTLLAATRRRRGRA